MSGDTDSDDPLALDEEIAWLLSETGDNPYETAVRLLKITAGRLARESDVTVGDVSVKLSQRANALFEQADRMRTEVRRTTAAAGTWIGSDSVSGKDAEERNTDREQPSFTRRTTRSRINRYNYYPSEYDRYFRW